MFVMEKYINHEKNNLKTPKEFILFGSNSTIPSKSDENVGALRIFLLFFFYPLTLKDTRSVLYHSLHQRHTIYLSVSARVCVYIYRYECGCV